MAKNPQVFRYKYYMLAVEKLLCLLNNGFHLQYEENSEFRGLTTKKMHGANPILRNGKVEFVIVVSRDITHYSFGSAGLQDILPIKEFIRIHGNKDWV